jgi:hypothetical protein
MQERGEAPARRPSRFQTGANGLDDQ